VNEIILIMSATLELLVEELRILEDKIIILRSEGVNVSDLEDKKLELTKKLLSASQALAEGRNILKG